MGTKHTFDTNLGQSEGAGRNLVLCIDGTWNDPSDIHEPGKDATNVYKLSEAVDTDAGGQVVCYFSGVGSEDGWLSKAFGGAFGWGAFQIRNEAYVTLVKNYRRGDRIFLFGFSRGAAITRMLANVIDKKGIPATITYSTVKNKAGKEEIRRFKTHGSKVNVKIDMLGVWDTVAAFGIPVNLLGIPFQKINLFRKLTISSNIKKAYHLVAVDENRDAFTPTLMNHDPERIQEVWVPGVHSDVGGGYKERRLADLTLTYMLARAQEHGLNFKQASLAALNPDSLGEVHYHGRRPGNYKMSARKIGVSQNDKIIADVKPKIHRAVLDRMKKQGNAYRPANVAALEGVYEVMEPDSSMPARGTKPTATV